MERVLIEAVGDVASMLEVAGESFGASELILREDSSETLETVEAVAVRMKIAKRAEECFEALLEAGRKDFGREEQEERAATVYRKGLILKVG